MDISPLEMTGRGILRHLRKEGGKIRRVGVYVDGLGTLWVAKKEIRKSLPRKALFTGSIQLSQIQTPQ